jgi:hypothetical protein
MTDTATRIGPTALTGSAATVYTVPSVTTFLMRSVQVCNEGASAANFTMSIGADGAGKRLFKDYSVPANGVLLETVLLSLAAAEVLQAFSSTGGAALTLTIGGIQIT